MTELLSKDTETNVENKNSYKKYLIGALAVATALFIYHEASKNKPTAPVIPEQTPKCASTWEMPGISHNNGDWVSGGIEIKKSGEKTDARDVLTNWFDQIDNDNATLDYFAESVHKAADKKIVNIDKKQLINSEGCATDLAANEASYVKDKLKTADISYGVAPAQGRNSYINIKGEVVFSAVTDKRDAIIIDFHNGNLLYILGVCGNVVTVQDIRIIRETKKDNTKHETHKDKKDKLTEKSSNSNDYKQPGDGTEKDSGTGTKPKATISTPAESTPPKVETKANTSGKTNNGLVTD